MNLSEIAYQDSSNEDDEMEMEMNDENVDDPDLNDETSRIDKNVRKSAYNKVSYSESKRVVSTNSKNERIGPNEINPYSPSFHDFLNLPVKYSTDKKYDQRDNYPLISSSYANTKVQSGANSYNINNHKPYHQEAVTKVYFKQFFFIHFFIFDLLYIYIYIIILHSYHLSLLLVVK